MMTSHTMMMYVLLSRLARLYEYRSYFFSTEGRVHPVTPRRRSSCIYDDMIEATKTRWTNVEFGEIRSWKQKPRTRHSLCAWFFEEMWMPIAWNFGGTSGEAPLTSRAGTIFARALHALAAIYWRYYDIIAGGGGNLIILCAVLEDCN